MKFHKELQLDDTAKYNQKSASVKKYKQYSAAKE